MIKQKDRFRKRVFEDFVIKADESVSVLDLHVKLHLLSLSAISRALKFCLSP